MDTGEDAWVKVQAERLVGSPVMCHDAVGTLQSSLTSIGSGRAFVTRRLREWGVTDDDAARESVHHLLLVTSELLTNAVRASSDELTIRLEAHHDRIAIAVTDDCPAPAEVVHAGPADEHGRGLYLVEALSRAWGQRFDGMLKTVWAEIAVPAGSALSVGCTVR
ncbi:MAG: ATP-binding protein [Acidimicrobiales bacterium]